MPIPQTYYLNAPSLGSATSVFLDPYLSICAPDGYYSDGVITRQQVSCVLYADVPCAICGIPCGEITSVTGAQGYYNMNIDAGASTGAIVVKFRPYGIPNGIQVLFNSTVFNKFSSPLYGLLAGPPGLPIYLGNQGNDCGLIANSPFTLNKFLFNGSSFIPTGSTESVTVLLSQMFLTTPSDPAMCVMVIPKTSATPTDVQVTIIGPCADDSFAIQVGCPTKLPDCSSTEAGELATLCTMPETSLFYNAAVSGDGFTLGLYDYVFIDSNGEFPLPDGYYKTSTHVTAPNDTIQVLNGVIVDIFQNCP